MGSGGGGHGGSRALRHQEDIRQNRVNEGLAAINAVFDGGTYGVGDPGKYEKGTQYYTPEGKAWQFDPNDPAWKAYYKAFKPTNNWFDVFDMGSDMFVPGTGRNRVQDLTKDHVPGMIRDFIKRQIKDGALFSGTKTEEGFTPEFYSARTKAYEDFAVPQLAKQYNAANKNLTFKLANQGLLHGSAGTSLNNSLQGEFDVQRKNIADTGLGLAQDLQRQVEQNRSNLTTQLLASADPSIAKQGAYRAATQLSAPSPLQPVGNLFNNWAQIYMLKNQIPTTTPGTGGGENNNRGYGVPTNPVGGSQRVIGGQ